MISLLKITKENNSAKKADGGTILISASRRAMLYICAKFCEIISNGIKVIKGNDFYTENYKGE